MNVEGFVGTVGGGGFGQENFGNGNHFSESDVHLINGNFRFEPDPDRVRIRVAVQRGATRHSGFSDGTAATLRS